MKYDLPRLSTGVLALTVLYALFGGFARAPEMMGGLSIYAAPVWLPAGIALGALLIHGRALWPGVWLGAFATALPHFQDHQQVLAHAIAAAAIIASGATLQALLGISLVHRFIGRKPALDTVPEVLRFFLLCGPLASLVSATIDTATHSLAGDEALTGLFLEWLSWWSGDTIGVLFATPVVLALGASPKTIWRPRRLTVALPLLFAALLVTMSFYIVGRLEHDNRQAEFGRHATLLSRSVQEAFRPAAEATLVIADFYHASKQVDADEFALFAAGLHRRHPDIQALEWGRRVPGEARTDYERTESVRIFEMSSANTPLAASQRAEYFPVQHAYPQAANAHALGFDLASEPVRRQALETAWRERRLAVSGRVQLVEDPGEHFGVLVAAPVFDSQHDDAPLAGYAIAAVHIATMLEGTLASLAHEDIAYRLTDLDAPAMERLLLESGRPSGTVLYRHAHTFEFGGRHWRIDIEADESYRFEHRAWYAWAMLASSVIVSALLTFFLLILSGRTAHTEQLVRERTAELESARAAAEKVRHLLEEAVDSIAQGFTIYDESDRLVVCNEAYKSFYETSRDLIVPGNTFEEIVRRGAERGQYAAAIGRVDAWVKERVAQHQSADGRIIEQRLDDGRWLMIVEYRTPSGFIAGNRIDITELKRTAAALGDRNAQLDTIFQLSPDGLVSFDLDGRIKSVNTAFRRMTGLLTTEVIGHTQAELERQLRALAEHPDQWPGLEPCFSEGKVGTGGTVPEQTERHLLTLQRPRAAALDLIGVNSNATTLSRLLYLRDVTHEVEVDRMKSEFLSHAAHELRTPMASIFGFTELLMTQEFDEATRKDLLATIYTQTAWLVDIINELLDLARIESRRGKDFSITTVPLPAMVTDVLHAIPIDIERWPVTADVPNDLPPALADAAKLRQALTNVIGNAVKYSPEGGAITIRGMTRVNKGRPQVGLVVTDHGIGMTPEQVARVGERFYRADTSGNIPGTGLGMAIVKEIIELLGGHFAVESVAGQGSTVSLWLPTDEPAANAATGET